MKLSRYLVISVMLFFGMIQACLGIDGNQDMRTWTLASLASGPMMTAELLSYVEKTGRVVLRTPDQVETGFQEKDFCATDRAWLLEWLEIGEELQSTLKRLGGKLEHLEVKGVFLTEYFIYHPSGTQPSQPLPMMVLFDPGGKARRYALRHMEAADKVKMRLVVCGSFKNAINNQEETAFSQRFQEVLLSIQQNVAHNPKQIFIGGTAGGAARAYAYAAAYPQTWAGIYANGGRLSTLAHDAYDNRSYPAVRVAMVNGERDENNRWIQSDSAVLHRNGCDVAILAFEGGLQLPTISVQTKAFRWLLKIDQ